MRMQTSTVVPLVPSITFVLAPFFWFSVVLFQFVSNVHRGGSTWTRSCWLCLVDVPYSPKDLMPCRTLHGHTLELIATHVDFFMARSL